MFGVVPKTMWDKQIACDSRNRIRLACNCLLVRTPDELLALPAESLSMTSQFCYCLAELGGALLANGCAKRAGLLRDLLASAAESSKSKGDDDENGGVEAEDDGSLVPVDHDALVHDDAAAHGGQRCVDDGTEHRGIEHIGDACTKQPKYSVDDPCPPGEVHEPVQHRPEHHAHPAIRRGPR